MYKRFCLKFKNQTVGYFIESEGQVEYQPNHEVASMLPSGQGYPVGLFRPIISNGRMRPDIEHLPTSQDIERWLSNRIFPKERQGAEQILRSLRLNKYDPWRIAKKTRAISFNDYYWVDRKSVV